MSSPAVSLDSTSFHSTPTQEAKTSFHQKIYDLAKFSFALLGHALLFATNPTVYVVGFTVGIMWDEKIGETLEKIANIWKKQRAESILIGAAAAILSLQVTWALTSLAFSAKLGCSLVVNSQT